MRICLDTFLLISDQVHGEHNARLVSIFSSPSDVAQHTTGGVEGTAVGLQIFYRTRGSA